MKFELLSVFHFNSVCCFCYDRLRLEAPHCQEKRSPTTSHGGGGDVVHDKDSAENPDKIKVYSFYLLSRETAETLALMQGNRDA